MDSILARLSQFITHRQAGRAYVVGGFVRDRLLGKPVADIDVAVPGDAPELAQKLALSWGGSFVLLDEENSIARVVLPGEKGGLTVDFTTLRGSIEQDLSQRDFTVDALAIDLETAAGDWTAEAVIDPLGGKHDLQSKLIRAVSHQAFEQDPARLLRAVRIAAEYGFTIDGATEELLQQYSALVSSVAGERLREELCRLLALTGAARHLSYLDRLGLLTKIIPELEPARGVDQPVEHFWDVFQHSIEAVAAVEFLLHAGDELTAQQTEIMSAVPWSETLQQHFQQHVAPGVNRVVLLKLAALLHDIAKPQTKTLENGRARFLGHPQEGESITAIVLERLRFSNHEKKIVTGLVRHHLRPGQLSDAGLPSRRALYRYFRDTGEVALDTLFLGLADHLATRGPRLDLVLWKEHCQLVDYILQKYFEEQNVVSPAKLVDGHDLMTSLDLKPGPLIGELLELVREAQAANEIHSREEALALVRKRLSLACSRK